MDKNNVGRTRQAKNRDLERYVKRDSRGYISYKHPLMDKPQTFGKDVAAANEVARIVNARLSNQQAIIQRILSPVPSGATLSMVAQRFREEYIPTLDWSKDYEDGNLAKLKTMETAEGSTVLSSLSVLDVNSLIDNNFSGDGRRLARNLLIHLYRFAIGKGLHAGVNVAEQVLKPPTADRVRNRIANYQHFQIIYEHAIPVVQLAMIISLITLQARLELCKMRLTDQQPNGKLRVIRQKTSKAGKKKKPKKASQKVNKAYIEMDIGPDLRKALTKCKEIALQYGSPFVLNYPSKGRSKVKEHRCQVLPRFLSGKFKEAVDACGLYDDLDPDERPTFHEVRSLGGRIYEAMGKSEEFIQSLYGHHDIEMTQHYLEGDQIVWAQATADMDLSRAALVVVNE